MARYKLNTLVIEYDKSCPAAGRNSVIRWMLSDTEQHALLLKTAHDHFIDVIPLQQSFGHLEYALKLPEYQHLRELPRPRRCVRFGKARLNWRPL